jgi:hypothetical protein
MLVYALLGPLQGLARRGLVLPFHVMIEQLAYSCVLPEEKMAFQIALRGVAGFWRRTSALNKEGMTSAYAVPRNSVLLYP